MVSNLFDFKITNATVLLETLEWFHTLIYASPHKVTVEVIFRNHGLVFVLTCSVNYGTL